MGLLIGIAIFIMILFAVCKPKDPSGVVLYFANIGTGKTTYLSKIAQQEIKKMAKGKSQYKYIVSNAIISGVKYIPDIRHLLKTGALEATLILLDEGSIEYNNRKMQMSEAEIKYFKLIRHYKSTLIVLSQSYDDIDVTLRRLYTQIYILRWLPVFTLIQPIKKRVGIDEMTKQIIDEYHFTLPFSWRVFCRPIYFKYFNSWWVPSDVDVHDLEKYATQPEYRKPKRGKMGIMSNAEVIAEIEKSEQPERNLAPVVEIKENRKNRLKFPRREKKLDPVKEMDTEIQKEVEEMTQEERLKAYYGIK